MTVAVPLAKDTWVNLGTGPLTVEAPLSMVDIVVLVQNATQPTSSDGIPLNRARHFDSAVAVWALTETPGYVFVTTETGGWSL